MSTTTATKSKPSSAPKPARPRLKAVYATPASELPSAAGVPEATIEMVALGELVRAPENVRHIRPDEDVSSLADNIAANGLLQSLIGYRAEHELRQRESVWIVGGGRRLAALQALWDRGDVEQGYRVPVLVRPREQAIELSLSENIEKRDMSPVDEFLAFRHLIELGTYDEAELAKRFGYSTRYIRQRLRLAQAAPQVLDALAERKITLDSALAYAASQDVKLQAEVFAQQEKSSWDQHKPHKIQAAYGERQATTKSPLYLFIGAEGYEAAGGGYEDDLFADTEPRYGGGRKLRDGHLLLDLAMDLIHEKASAQADQLRLQYPGYAGFVIPPNAKTGGYPWKAPPAPKGCALVESGYGTDIWKAAAKAEAPITAIVGIDGSGKLAVKQDALFVPKEFAAKVKPPAPPRSTYTPPSAEDVAKARREAAIEEQAWRLGVGTFAGTPLDGRAFWPQGSWISPTTGTTKDGRPGKLVAVQIFVSDEEYAAQRAEAERRVDAKAAEVAAEKAAFDARVDGHADRLAEILAMDPPPAVLVADGPDGRQPWVNLGARGWAEIEKAPADDDELIDSFDTLAALIDTAEPGELLETFASVEAYRAREAAEAA